LRLEEGDLRRLVSFQPYYDPHNLAGFLVALPQCPFNPPVFIFLCVFQFLPSNLVERCSLSPGQDVALLDCMGRTSTTFVESCVDVFYLGRGWKEFLEVIDASKGDLILFEFTAARTCRVAVFNGKFGWQKYPYVDAQHEYTVLNPREPNKALFV
jgi:hypothetical protein